ncbi:hypothetical protein SAY87_020811 [Trapa incisa]|uniref:Inhibitor I9 domain-containing protein n=1 Tax=Trapa incisa TaxID=236973 RepID=A0AAN7PQC5_9MYRT|nr:hypothetical protein SAY87_020811 [Trapa incisa]
MQTRRVQSFSLVSPPLLLVISIFISSIAIVMAEVPSEATVHIIFTEKPPVDDVESHHIHTLTAVLGSEEAAKQSLIYVYKNAATGFSAKLTPQQVEELSKQPGVLQIMPSQKMQLHSGRVGLH